LQQCEVVRIARGQRQRLDFFFAQRAALLDLGEVNQRRISRDGDRFRQGTHRQPHVNHRRLSGAKRDTGLFEFLESL
jgi:hypothetical protein